LSAAGDKVGKQKVGKNGGSLSANACQKSFKIFAGSLP
jgi:hypothetical protein